MLPSVCFHPRAFWYGRFGGIARYVCELAAHLEKLGVEIHIPIRETHCDYLRQAAFFARTSAETIPAPALLRLIRHWGAHSSKADFLRRMELRAQGLNFLRRGNFDILHPSDNNSTELLPFIGKKTLVVTVHDMTHELYPHAFWEKDPSAQRKKAYAERANRIIAISECTKNDLVRLLGISPEKIDVVHHGNSLILPPNHKEMELPLPERYILFVGKRWTYKNFSRFLRAAARLMEKDDSLHLVCTGGGSFTPAELRLMESLHIAPNRVRTLFPSDEELAVIYNRALGFVYPSEYEGFGLPILEAWECQTPVICARASCFPEVAGEAAAYFDPLSEEEMAAQMESVCFNEERRRALIAAGRMRLQKFSWSRCAEETLACYRRALAEGS